MLAIAPLPLHLLVLALQKGNRFAATVTAFRAARNAALRPPECTLSRAGVARVLHDLPICRDEEYLQAHVDASLLARGRQGIHRYLRTRAAGVPPIGFPADRDRLGGAMQGSMHPQAYTAYLRQTEDATVQHCAAVLAHLQLGDASIAILALETRITGVLARLHATKERLEGSVQLMQHVLQDLGVEVAIFRPYLLDARQLRRLHGKAYEMPHFSQASFRSSSPAL
jgi:hypothetical protein